MSNYTPTTEDVREVAQTLSKCREFDPELCDGCNRRVQDAERLLKSRWLAEHDREQRAIGWDERDNAKPSYLGPDYGHYLDDCGGYEDCFCASYPNPYREVSK